MVIGLPRVRVRVRVGVRVRVRVGPSLRPAEGSTRARVSYTV